MPRKVRHLIRDLNRAGFIEIAVRGDHREFVHPQFNGRVMVSGKMNGDAKPYQEQEVREAIDEVNL